jgi:hypothetical protein
MKVIAFLIGSYLAATEYWRYRHSQMESLHSTAISSLSEAPAAELAIRKVNTYAGSGATDLLLKIATADRDFVDGRQDIAIRLLIQRREPKRTSRVATLLQPSVGLARREVVATELQNAVCDNDCTRYVLHCLERGWAGFGIREDITDVAAHFDVGPIIENEQADVGKHLYQTLKMNYQSTLSVLRDTYGLGSPVPSAFSLSVLSSIRLKQACILRGISKEQDDGFLQKR